MNLFNVSDFIAWILTLMGETLELCNKSITGLLVCSRIEAFEGLSTRESEAEVK